MIRITNFNQGRLPQITQPAQGFDPRIMAALLQRQNPDLGQGQNPFASMNKALFQNALKQNRQDALKQKKQIAANKQLDQQALINQSRNSIPSIPFAQNPQGFAVDF